MKKLFVGNPLSLLLGFSVGARNFTYFVVQEERDLRDSPRDTTLALILQKSIANFFKIQLRIISFEQFENEYWKNQNFVTEFRFVTYFRNKYRNLKFPNVEAISYGADVFLANSNFKEMSQGPRSFKVIQAWKKEFKILWSSNINDFINKHLTPDLIDISMFGK